MGFPLKSPASLLESRLLLTLALLAALGWSLSNIDWDAPLVHSGGGASALRFLLALFPPDLSPEFLAIAAKASWYTIAYAVAGVTLAVAIGLPLGAIASGTILREDSPWRRPLMAGSRLFLAALRSVHELVWAVLLVASVGLSPMAGILALALPYGGILGRIYADLLQDVPQPPLRALRASGAPPLAALVYGHFQMALPDILSYTFYRLECGIRSAAILSFVGIQGLGYQIQLSMHDLLFSQVWTLLIFLVGIIVLVDAWSTYVRRSLVS